MTEQEVPAPEYKRPKNTKIYQFATGRWSTGDEVWWAVSEEGEILKNHISSSRAWGLHDTGPNGFAKEAWDRFEDPVGIVLEEGAYPPDEVLARAGFEKASAES